MFSKKPNAKINCGLNILGRRPDGFHNIESIFIGVDLCDELVVEASDSLNVQCYPDVTPTITQNLVYRAADAFRQALNAPDKGAKIVLTKSIPAGGGLGGGSSDAAATLTALTQLWDEPKDLQNLALQLGSDVPFFLTGGIAYVTGRGEKVVTMPGVWTHPKGPVSWFVLLVLPEIHIDTADAFSLLDNSSFSEPQRLDTIFARAIENKELFQMRFSNVFEEPIFRAHPLLFRIKRQLYDAGAFYASMSGSGSSMYGMFENVAQAEQARSSFPEHGTYICRPLNAVSP